MSGYVYKKEILKNLVLKSQKGDIKALEELIRRIQRDVFGMFCYLADSRQDIADLTQEVLLKMAKNINTLKDPEHFKSWLNHIITNEFYDYTRKHKSDSNIVSDNEKLLEIKDKIGCEPGEKCLFAEMDKLIRAALLDLPDTLRIVIILREYEGLSYDDISKITHTNTGTVKSRIARARIKLKKNLKEFI